MLQSTQIQMDLDEIEKILRSVIQLDMVGGWCFATSSWIIFGFLGKKMWRQDV